MKNYVKYDEKVDRKYVSVLQEKLWRTYFYPIPSKILHSVFEDGEISNHMAKAVKHTHTQS